MYLFPVIVKNSSIEGKGVFTTGKIEKGSIVWKYEPTHDRSISLEEYEKMSEEEKRYMDKIAYLSSTSDRYIFPPENDPALYTNHSADSNNLSTVLNNKISLEPHFVANRDILLGEELTNNYHEFDAAISKSKEKPDWL